VIGAALTVAGLGAGHPRAAQFATMSVPAWWIVALCGAVVAVPRIVTTTRHDTTRHARASAERAAQTSDEPLDVPARLT
jgi:hypothetical protein